MIKPPESSIKVEGLEKVYRIWNTPQSILKKGLCDGLARVSAPIPGLRHWFHQSAEGCYRDFFALRGVSFSVAPGECLGIIGYNGSGKSTLLQIIAGTLQPTRGSSSCRGRVAALLELGAGFNPEFTGRENAYLNGSILGMTMQQVEEKMPAIEDFAEIGDFIDQPVKTYSSGMQIRLAFSVLTQIDPDILIVDEALAVGDAYFQHKSMQQMKRFRQQGKSILLVSHDPGMIKAMCDRAIILENGRLIRDGSAEAVADYYNALVARKQKDSEIRQVELQSGRVVTRSGNQKMVIDQFELIDEAGIPTRAFLAGGRARITAILTSNEEILNPTVGFLIRDRLGNDVFGTNTFHLDLASGPLQAGDRLQVEFDLDLDLGSGSYSLTLAAHLGDNHLIESYDWFDHVIAFVVMPGRGPKQVGTARLPVTANLSREIRPVSRSYSIGDWITFGIQGNARRHLVRGWSFAEAGMTWTDGSEAVLGLNLSEWVGPFLLEVSWLPFVSEQSHTQSVIITVNGHPVADLALSEAGEDSLALPPEAMDQGDRLELRFELPDAALPTKGDRITDNRKLAVAFRKIRLVKA